MTEQHLTAIPLASFDFPPPLMQGVREAGFDYCTPIQATALPLALAGQDVAGQAQTGTGKTAAYLLAIMTRLIKAAPLRHPHQPRALIIAPTRELAVQIHKDAELLGKYTSLRLAVVYGGTGYDQQRRQLEEGTDILIGTPGRLIDYYQQRIFDLRSITAVVVDEADRMFDLGFIKDIRYLLRRLPKPDKRLGLLFSATLSFKVMELAYEHMNNPKLLQGEAGRIAAERINELVYYPSNEEKIPLLIGLLKKMDPTRTMVFVNTKRAAETVQTYLETNGFSVAVLSGDVPQKKRLQWLAAFEAGEIAILVATDVAARGLHIPGVSHVFNFDLPQDAEDYVHRIGRTARAGASGDAISFVCETYAFSLPDIEKYVGHSIPSASVATDLLAEVRRPSKSDRRPRDARRSSGQDRRSRRDGRKPQAAYSKPSA